MNGENRKPQAHIIAALTYLLGFVTGLIFLYLEPYNQDELRPLSRASVDWLLGCVVRYRRRVRRIYRGTAPWIGSAA